MGDSLAPIQILEFADMQCPACRHSNNTVAEAEVRYPGKIGRSFIHFPLPMHRFAAPAARALHCADAQGRFAAMHDSLFAQQDSFGITPWLTIANSAGVRDSLAFKSCMSEQAPAAEVVAGTALGEQFKVLATPTVVVNGWRFPSSPSPSMLNETIDALLGWKEATWCLGPGFSIWWNR